MNHFKTLKELILSRKDETTNGIFFVHPQDTDEFISYAQLVDESLQALTFLQEKNVKPGDKVILQIEDNHQFIVAFWACIIGGIIVAPIAAQVNQENLSRLYNVYSVLGDAFILSSIQKKESIIKRMKEENLETNILENRFLFTNMMHQSGTNYEEVIVTPDDLAFIQFSSGSTGVPKGILLTHENVMFSIEKMGKRLRLVQKDINVYWLPLTYDMGLIACHLLSIYYNSMQVELSTADFMQNPYTWLEAASRYKATYLVTSGSSLEIARKCVLDKNLELDYTRLSKLVIGGEMIRAEKCRAFLKEFARFGIRDNVLFPAYGMAETTLGVALPDPNETFSPLIVDTTSFVPGKAIRYCDSIDNDNILELTDSGYAIEECEIRITDDFGNDLGEDVFGIIEVKGACVYQGYYNKENSHHEKIEWYHSRDYGFLHNHRLTVAGRMDDVIIINGQNYFITDLTRVISTCKTASGHSSTICKRIDKKTGEETLAIIIEFTDSLLAFTEIIIELREAFYKYGFLKIDYIIPVPSIPKSDSGKIRNSVIDKDINSGKYDALVNELQELMQSNSISPDVSDDDLINMILDTWEEISGIRIGPDDNFYTFGMDSLLLSEFVTALTNTLGTKIKVADLFYCSTISEIAQLL